MTRNNEYESEYESVCPISMWKINIVKRDYAALWTYFLLLKLFFQYIQNKQTFLPFSGMVWSFKITIFYASVSEACSEPFQTSEIEIFAESR